MTDQPTPPDGTSAALSDRLEAWLDGTAPRTVDGLADVFGARSFALVFMVLLAPSALPLPTGGATNVFEIVAALTAVQLVAGRDTIWIPRRWRAVELARPGQRRVLGALLRTIRVLERISRPRLAWLFHHRVSDAAFGLVVIAFVGGAFVAPPFSGLDTLPSLGVVLISLAVLLDDALVLLLGLVAGVAGIALEIALGKAVLDALGGLV